MSLSVEIVTGPLDSGKTSQLLRLFGRDGGCGVVMPKVFDPEGRHIGYDALLLPSRERVALCRLREPLAAAGCRWRFDPDAFARVNAMVAELMAATPGPLYLDEVGALELRGEGFAPLLRAMLASGRPLRLGMRQSLAPELTKAFGV